jgi:DNA-binding response OmpR family regulator
METTTRRRSVLLVDDSELACEAVKHTLGGAGFEVTALNSPFGLIKAIRETQPVVILVDVGLGSVNGTRLVELARQNAPARCSVLLYSGREANLLEIDAIASGADGFITKSTTGTELIAVVRQWVGGARTSMRRE